MKTFLNTLILIIFKIIPIVNIIVFPFQIRKTQKKGLYDANEYYIYTQFEMGDPPQKVNCELNFDINDYFMTYSPLNVQPTYNSSLSKSIINTSMNGVITSRYTLGHCAYENFYFYTDLECQKKEIFESLIIIFPPTENKLAGCEIGLQSRHSNGKLENFIHNLKTKEIINSYIWTLKFKNLNEGIIIFGAAPHEYDSSNFNENELKFANTFSEKDKLYWCLHFKYDPISKNYTLSQNIKVKISPKILGVVATYNYLNAVEEIFFKKYYQNNICEKKIVSFENTNYFKIICSKDDFTQNDINKFPSLNLFNIVFNYTFILEGKELFTENEEGDAYEFLILIEIGSTRIEWKLGRIFLLKYQMTFDDDNSLIGFYKHIEIIENNNNSNNIFSTVVKYVILGFVIIIFIFLAFIIYKKLNVYFKRKKLANELEDDFMYIVGRNSDKSDKK